MCVGARIITLIILLLFMHYVCSSHNHWLRHSATFYAWPVCCMPPSPNAVLLLLKGGHGIFNTSNNLSVSCAALIHALWQERHWWVYTSADSQKRSFTLSQQGLEPTVAHFTGLPLPLIPVQQAKPLSYSLPPEAWLSMHSACTLTLRMHRLNKANTAVDCQTYPQIVGEHEGEDGNAFVVIATSHRATDVARNCQTECIMQSVSITPLNSPPAAEQTKAATLAHFLQTQRSR